MEELVQKLADLEEGDVLAIVGAEVEKGTDPLEIFDACRRGMVIVGQRYEEGEYFVSELMMAAAIFKEVTGILEPAMAGRTAETKGSVVVGTVEGDIHDIGKDLVVGMLQAGGFEVHDLGVDVLPAAFVEKARETGATVVSLSGLMTTSFDPMKATVSALAEAGLRPGVKVMIGGGPVTEKVQTYTGADAWGDSAQAAVNLANQWMGG
jgi:methanogenic corrinoid protein MtbC1